MRARKSGHVIFTGSSAAHAPGANFAVYAATKAAIAAFATALRAEVSADGIRVTELVPGRVETALYQGVISDDARAAMYAGGGSLQPSDIADVVLAVLRLPPHADVTRLDIMPTRPVPPISLK
jgi:NADP-dependent 3-hydroxy acid dehydrogenase YdfG